MLLREQRIGVGTLQLAGNNGWGRGASVAECRKTLRAAMDRGVRVFDTAWYYGPDCVNELIAETLYPYPDDLLLICKIGSRRHPMTHEYEPATDADSLREACNRTLKTLRIDYVPLLMLRWRADLDYERGFDSAWSVMLDLQREGKAQHLGLSNVSVADVVTASRMGRVEAVSNAYSLLDRSDEHVLVHCEQNGIRFLPYYPLQRGAVNANVVISDVASQLGATSSQVALGWLLARSEAILPIPGTNRVDHLLENIEALALNIPPRAQERLSLLGAN